MIKYAYDTHLFSYDSHMKGNTYVYHMWRNCLCSIQFYVDLHNCFVIIVYLILSKFCLHNSRISVPM